MNSDKKMNDEGIRKANLFKKIDNLSLKWNSGLGQSMNQGFLESEGFDYVKSLSVSVEEEIKAFLKLKRQNIEKFKKNLKYQDKVESRQHKKALSDESIEKCNKVLDINLRIKSSDIKKTKIINLDFNEYNICVYQRMIDNKYYISTKLKEKKSSQNLNAKSKVKKNLNYEIYDDGVQEILKKKNNFRNSSIREFISKPKWYLLCSSTNDSNSVSVKKKKRSTSEKLNRKQIPQQDIIKKGVLRPKNLNKENNKEKSLSKKIQEYQIRLMKKNKNTKKIEWYGEEIRLPEDKIHIVLKFESVKNRNEVTFQDSFDVKIVFGVEILLFEGNLENSYLKYIKPFLQINPSDFIFKFSLRIKQKILKQNIQHGVEYSIGQKEYIIRETNKINKNLISIDRNIHFDKLRSNQLTHLIFKEDSEIESLKKRCSDMKKEMDIISDTNIIKWNIFLFFKGKINPISVTILLLFAVSIYKLNLIFFGEI